MEKRGEYIRRLFYIRLWTDEDISKSIFHYPDRVGKRYTYTKQGHFMEGGMHKQQTSYLQGDTHSSQLFTCIWGS